MADWDEDDMALLGQAALDLTALAATLAVLRRRRPADPLVVRADALATRLHGSLSHLIENLRG